MRRGFSLVELLVTIAVSSAGLVAVAHVARMAVRQSGRGTQVNQVSMTTQVISRQIRADLEVAGYGSTGAVGVAGGFAGAIAGASRGAGLGTARPGIPAVQGVDGATGLLIGGANVLPGSDLLQLVVPDPSQGTTTLGPVEAGATCAALDAALVDSARVTGCTLRYLSDHTVASGAGRTQLLRCGGATSDATAFNLASGADVLCARWSTYWVDTNFQLHRSDLDPDLGTTTIGGIEIPNGAGGGDVIATGVVDLQVAYRLSTEAPGVNSAATAWAYDGQSGTTVAGPGWFEARQVRVNMLFRSLRAVDDRVDTQDVPAMENRPANSLAGVLTTLRPNATSKAYRFVRMTTSQLLTNQRFFDLNLPTGVPADPY